MESAEKKRRLDIFDENEYNDHDMYSKEILSIQPSFPDNLSVLQIGEDTRGKTAGDWNQKAIIDVFLVGPLKYMNPFLAMKTFSGVSRIARALSTDKTTDGHILWTSYVKRYNLIPVLTNKVKLSDIDFNNLIATIKDKMPCHVEITTLLIRAHNNDFGLDKNPRHIFMWLWMMYRVITREICRSKNIDCHYHANMMMTNNSSTSVEAILAKRSCLIETRCPKILDSDLPSSYDIIAKYEKITDEFIILNSNSFEFKGLFTIFHHRSTALSRPSQISIYSVIKPIYDVLDFKRMCDSLYSQAINDFNKIIDYTRDTSNAFLAYHINFNKLNGSKAPFILDHGNLDIYDHIAIQQDIVNTTYPSNPDCGTGIYLG